MLDPEWRLPYRVADRSFPPHRIPLELSVGDEVLLKRSAPWEAECLPSVGEHVDLACLYNDGILIGSPAPKVESVTWVRLLCGKTRALPLCPVLALARIEGNERTLARMLDLGWLPVE